MKTDTPDHRTCPFCGVWMASGKRDQRSASDDRFECALCRTVIYIPSDGEPVNGKEPRDMAKSRS